MDVQGEYHVQSPTICSDRSLYRARLAGPGKRESFLSVALDNVSY